MSPREIACLGKSHLTLISNDILPFIYVFGIRHGQGSDWVDFELNPKSKSTWSVSVCSNLNRPNPVVEIKLNQIKLIWAD